MRRWRLALLLLGVGLAIAAQVRTVEAQVGDDPKALNKQVMELHRQGKYGEALPLAKQYVEAIGARHGKTIRYVSALNNFAQLLLATNQLAEAEPLMRRALAIDEKNAGPHHPDVAISLTSLAHLLYKTNRLSEAEPLLRRALAIDEKSFGTDDPKVAMRLNNLAQLLQDTNRLGKPSR